MLLCNNSGWSSLIYYIDSMNRCVRVCNQLRFLKPSNIRFPVRYVHSSKKMKFKTNVFRVSSIIKLNFSSFPPHKVVPMPALSPTMETGSISKWLLKEGDSFAPGQAICEVETDKATVTYEATDEGCIAKILVSTGEIKVGDPIMVTVDEASSVGSFANFEVGKALASSAPSVGDSSSTSTRQDNAPKAASHQHQHQYQYPPHRVVPMPALSPTMETGSISKWLLKEGDSFAPGQAICEVETDKATVTYEATDEGCIAKILVSTGEIKVGDPIMVTVEDASSVGAFSTFRPGQLAEAAIAAPIAAGTGVASSAVDVASISTASGGENKGRVFASPYARMLAKERQIDLAGVLGTGPNNRVIAADVMSFKPAATASTASVSVSVSGPSTLPSASSISDVRVTPKSPPPSPPLPPAVAVGVASSGATVHTVSSALASAYSISKKEVPHYYLSVEINVSSLQHMVNQLNQIGDGSAISINHLLIKAASKALLKVPEVNSSWQGSFVRRFEKTDINIMSGSGESSRAPVVHDVSGIGLSSIATQVLEGSTSKNSDLVYGTFSIHDLGAYGVKSAAPIILPPQAAALSLGAIQHIMTPNPTASDGDKWKVIPVMVCTLSCDHRVVDGAVGAQWLAAFKDYSENPLSLIL